MRGAILMQQHADHWAAGPFAPMGSASRRGLDPAMTL